MPRESGFLLPRFGVPQPHRIVAVTPTYNRFPIGTVRYTMDPARMPRESGFLLPRVGVPQPHLVVSVNSHLRIVFPSGLYATLMDQLAAYAP